MTQKLTKKGKKQQQIINNRINGNTSNKTEAKNNEYKQIKEKIQKHRIKYRLDEYVHQNKGITPFPSVISKTE